MMFHVAIPKRAVPIILVLIGAITMGAYWLHKDRQIVRLERSFSQLAIGDTAEKVAAEMGAPHRVRMGKNQLLFQGDPLGSDHVPVSGKTQPIVQFSYSVDSFFSFLHCNWFVSFDQNMTIVSKERMEYYWENHR